MRWISSRKSPENGRIVIGRISLLASEPGRPRPRLLVVMRLLAATSLIALLLVGCGKDAKPLSTNKPDAVVDSTADPLDLPQGTEEDSVPKEATEWTSETDSGPKVTMKTGGEPSAQDMGLPLYPGSSRDKSDPGDVVLTEGDLKTVSIVVWTKDSISKVLAFYRKHIVDIDELETPDGALLMGLTAEGKEATLLMSKEPQGLRVQLTVVSKQS
ncbi:hypothetical protein QPK87_06195 [Kamptonema cortianum]|nr:hypothetical protein [Geitlerinema splendidum]MDK3156164.1 hypothetical protein [Kamptonema cortianum]